MLKQQTIILKIKRTKCMRKHAKHNMGLENNVNTTSKKTRKTRIKPGSSHPYTQRQLVLERKLKTTCPQVRIFTLDTTKIRIHFQEKQGNANCCWIRKSEIQSSSIYLSDRKSVV